jgi:hypothetical protein
MGMGAQRKTPRAGRGVSLGSDGAGLYMPK